MLCVLILYISGGTYKFKVDSERQKETFHGSFILLSEFLPEICWEEIGEEIFFVFCFDVWPEVRTLAFRLINQHTTTRLRQLLLKDNRFFKMLELRYKLESLAKLTQCYCVHSPLKSFGELVMTCTKRLKLWALKYFKIIILR